MVPLRLVTETNRLLVDVESDIVDSSHTVLLTWFLSQPATAGLIKHFCSTIGRTSPSIHSNNRTRSARSLAVGDERRLSAYDASVSRVTPVPEATLAVPSRLYDTVPCCPNPRRGTEVPVSCPKLAGH